MSENNRRNNNGKGSTIGCDAANCAYNEHGTACSAEHIRVDGKSARSTGETCCSTFRTKDSTRF